MEPNDTEYSDTDSISLSTDTLIDTYKDTKPILKNESINFSIDSNEKEKNIKQNQMLKESLKEKIPSPLYDTLSTFSDNYEQMYKWYGILLRAKNKVEKERNLLLDLQNIAEEANKVLMGGIRVIRTNSKIENIDNYLFITLFRGFEKIAFAIKQNEPSAGILNYNWLEGQ